MKGVEEILDTGSRQEKNFKRGRLLRSKAQIADPQVRHTARKLLKDDILTQYGLSLNN